MKIHSTLFKVLTICMGAMLFQQASAADDADALIETARCYMCHQQNNASLGPPWTAIAARHAELKDQMVDVLARKIVHGGGGNWGLVPMVPNQWVNIEDARKMAKWILAQK